MEAIDIAISDFKQLSLPGSLISFTTGASSLSSGSSLDTTVNIEIEQHREDHHIFHPISFHGTTSGIADTLFAAAYDANSLLFEHGGALVILSTTIISLRMLKRHPKNRPK